MTGVPGSSPLSAAPWIRDDAENLVRGDLRRQGGARDMGERDQPVVHRVRLQVDEAGFQRPIRSMAR